MTRGTLRAASAVVILLAASAGNLARAARIDFYLTVNNVENTWELSASTDSPGGIGAIAVNLQNAHWGQSVAPRSVVNDMPFKGFTQLNLNVPIPIFGGTPDFYQAASGQNPTNIHSLVYGIGYTPVPDAEFGVQLPTINMIGSAETVPTVFYSGIYYPMYGTPSFHPQQNSLVAALYNSAPPPGGYDRPVLPSEITFTPQIVGYNVQIVPEPSTWYLLLLAIPVLWRTKVV
jgi:hypothetical protein